MTQQARSPHSANPMAAGNATPPNYDRTVMACFNGYVTQAVVNNFLPLLFAGTLFAVGLLICIAMLGRSRNVTQQ